MKYVIEVNSHRDILDMGTFLNILKKNNFYKVEVDDLLAALDRARTLSELCEEEAKRYEGLECIDDDGKTIKNAPELVASALRSFGSKQ